MEANIQITGASRLKCEEKWEQGLLDIAVEAASGALNAAAGAQPTGIYFANALGDALGDLRNGALYLSSALGLNAADAVSVGCGEVSGGVALRQAVAARSSRCTKRWPTASFTTI